MPGDNRPQLQSYSPARPAGTRWITLLLPVPWWRNARNLARIGLLVLALHLLVLVAFEPLRLASYVALGLSIAALLLLARPHARIGWRGDRIEIRAGRHRWTTTPGSIDLDAAQAVTLPAPGNGTPQFGRGEFKGGAYLGPGRWTERDVAVFCAARPGPALLVPVSPTQALLLGHRNGPQELKRRLEALLREAP